MIVNSSFSLPEVIPLTRSISLGHRYHLTGKRSFTDVFPLNMLMFNRYAKLQDAKIVNRFQSDNDIYSA